MTDRRQEFVDSLAAHAGGFGVRLDNEQGRRLADYFEMVERWNARLHLVAPCAPAEFAVRHVLESLLSLQYLPPGAAFADVGSGAGLPAIPCLVARADLRATLFESSAKKSVFLYETLSALGLREAARVVNARFEETTAPAVEAVACRAIERFAEVLPRLAAWSPKGARLLLFGGESLRGSVERLGRSYSAERIPESERRLLYIVEPAG